MVSSGDGHHISEVLPLVEALALRFFSPYFAFNSCKFPGFLISCFGYTGIQDTQSTEDQPCSNNLPYWH